MELAKAKKLERSEPTHKKLYCNPSELERIYWDFSLLTVKYEFLHMI